VRYSEDSQNFSVHIYTGSIARSCLRQLSCLVAKGAVKEYFRSLDLQASTEGPSVNRLGHTRGK